MPKYTPAPVTNISGNPVSAAATINNNLWEISEKLEESLSRTGELPNSMQAPLDMNFQRIINLPEAESDTDPVRKGEITDIVTAIVDDITQGPPGPPGNDGVGVPAGGTVGQVLSKDSSTDYDTSWADLPEPPVIPPVAFQVVKVKAQSNINIASGLENGDVVDGITLQTDDVILLGSQTNTAENGVYLVPTFGPAERSPYFDSFEKLAGAFFSVSEGTDADTLWFCDSSDSGVIDQDPVSIVEKIIEGIQTLVPGFGIDVDMSDPVNPVLSVDMDPPDSPKVTVVTASGTHTFTEGAVFATIEALGGGGAGGGSAATSSAEGAAGSGGGAGGYVKRLVGALPASVSITIGAAGVAASGSAGGNGGNTSVSGTGVSLTANGGTGGAVGAATGSSVPSGLEGGAGGTATGGDTSITGTNGYSSVLTPPRVTSGAGASTPYGAGGRSRATGQNGALAGIAGTGFGAGGGGSANGQSQSANIGGNGAPGVVIVTEFFSSHLGGGEGGGGGGGGGGDDLETTPWEAFSGSAERTLPARWGNLIELEEFGFVANDPTKTSENNSALTALISHANTHPGTTYRSRLGHEYHITATNRVFPSNIKLALEGAKFIWSGDIGGTNSCIFQFSDTAWIDALRVEITSGSDLWRALIFGSDLNANLIELISEDQINNRTGATLSDYAIRFEGGSQFIDRIRCHNLDNGVRFYGGTDGTNPGTDIRIGDLDITNYSNASYFRNLRDLRLISANIRGRSPNALSDPGYNGILCEGVVTSTFNNFTIKNSGEHGFRFGGSRGSEIRAKDVVVSNGVIYGSGQSGFKMFTGYALNRYERFNVSNLVITDSGDDGDLPGFNDHGLLIQQTQNSTFSNITIGTENRTYSSQDGIYVSGAQNVSMTGIYVHNAARNSLRVSHYDGGQSAGSVEVLSTNGLKINGFQGNNHAAEGVYIDCPDAPAMRDIHCENLSLVGGNASSPGVFWNGAAARAVQPCRFAGIIRNHNTKFSVPSTANIKTLDYMA